MHVFQLSETSLHVDIDPLVALLAAFVLNLDARRSRIGVLGRSKAWRFAKRAPRADVEDVSADFCVGGDVHRDILSASSIASSTLASRRMASINSLALG